MPFYPRRKATTVVIPGHMFARFFADAEVDDVPPPHATNAFIMSLLLLGIVFVVGRICEVAEVAPYSPGRTLIASAVELAGSMRCVYLGPRNDGSLLLSGP